jgi:hypothetical protein
MSTDLIHALAMLVWGLGLPLLVWHRYPRASRFYMWFALAFVSVSMLSHQLLGECFLTTLAREFWEASGGLRERVPFTVLMVNAISGMRPKEREAVLLWEVAVFVSSVGSLWCWYKTHPRSRSGRAPEASHASD